MIIKQVSIFMENREGRLEEVTQILKEHHINIVSLSLADTTEYGVLRLITSDPMEAKKVLKEAGFSAMVTEVVVVKLPHRIGALHELLKTLVHVNIEYMYALSTGENASMIIKLSDVDKAISSLEAAGFQLLTEEEAYGMRIS